ncbi:MAG TPA: SpoIIE family protein phosphatase [Actinocrinis sp.]|nr:SpoIIE family protein phosphatase [Actinocrinis sp.]
MAQFPEFDPATLPRRVDVDIRQWDPDLYPLLYDQLNLGVVVVDPAGRLLLANAWVREFFEPDNLHKLEPNSGTLDWSRIAHPDGRAVRPGTLPLERCMATGQPVGAEEYLYYATGGDRYISVAAVPILNEQGVIVAYGATVYSLTDLRRFLDQIGEIQRELDAHLTELGRMHSLIERLSSRVELPELLADTLDLVAEFNDADSVMIFLADPRSGELSLAASRGIDERERRILVSIPQPAMFTSQRAMKGLSTAIVDISSEPNLPADYRDAMEAVDVVSVYSMPLRSADSNVLGSVVSMFRRVRMPTAHQKALLDTCGRIIAQLIINARIRARDHDVATALQSSMLQVRLPQPQGCELAAHYRAGTTDLQAGGDWYEASYIGGGRLGMTIGDVIGHGVEAVGMMGQMRSALRAYTLTGDDTWPGPAEIVVLLDRWVAATGLGEASTMCTAVVDPATGEGVLSSAGHPAPLLVSKDEARYMHDTALGVPLGLLSIGGKAEEVHFLMPPGSVLLLYTDGLVERRGEDIQDGFDRLARVARRELVNAPEGDLHAACRRMVDECAPAGAIADDTAILALRYRYSA